MLRISQVAQRFGIEEEYMEPYGFYKAKISLDFGFIEAVRLHIFFLNTKALRYLADTQHLCSLGDCNISCHVKNPFSPEVALIYFGLKSIVVYPKRDSQQKMRMDGDVTGEKEGKSAIIKGGFCRQDAS